MSQFSNVVTVLTAGWSLMLCQPVRAEDPHQLSAQDRRFMMEAAKGGAMEVKFGYLGEQRGSTPGVKSFSHRLVDDHTKANDELMELARQKGLALPAENPEVTPQDLTTKTGSDFDREFARVAISDHEKDIAEFEKEANSGRDPDVKAWASKTLPTLRAHLDGAKALLYSSTSR
jgi:putative membrane protein